jgi:DNA-binding GntR family transcriptional regulator
MSNKDKNPVSKKTIASTVEEKIKADIINGKLMPNQKLRIKGLAERYDTGSIPLREALSRLTALGFIELIDHQGFSVRSITLEEIADITMVRCNIESQALENSIKNADLEWESRLLAIHHTLSNLHLIDPESDQLSEKWEKTHQDFHEALLSNCDSHWLNQLSSILRDQTSRYRFLSTHCKGSGNRDIPAEHARIIEAAIARDIDKAKTALCKHYENTAKIIAKQMIDL